MDLLFYKLKASSLVSTLILLLVLLITASLLLLSLYYFKYFKIKEEVDARLDDNISSAVEFILNDTLIMSRPFSDSFELFKGYPDSIFYVQELWGCIPLAGIRVAYKGKSKSKAMFYGASSYNYSDACLYVSDHDRPLAVAGDTYIQGKAYLPKAGLRSGFFGQQGFSRNTLIEGEIASSLKKLPSLNAALLENVKLMEALIDDTTREFERMPADALVHNFDLPARYIKLNKLGIIGNTKVIGKFILISDSVIEVSAGAQISDAILVAPYILFREGFKGIAQAFALDSITIGKECRLYYPSTITCIGRRSISGNIGSTVTIKENAEVEGIVMGLDPNGSSNVRPVVKVAKNATVKGLIYNTGYTYLSGRVEGAVFTDYFFEQRGTISMENILIDATIMESKWFTIGNCFSIFTHSHHPKVLQWLPQN